MDGLAMRRNTHRRSRNTERVIRDAVARGRTTVLTAEPIVATTRAAPTITARIRNAITARW
jgi:hypothetical protein